MLSDFLTSAASVAGGDVVGELVILYDTYASWLSGTGVVLGLGAVLYEATITENQTVLEYRFPSWNDLTYPLLEEWIYNILGIKDIETSSILCRYLIMIDKHPGI